MPISDSPARQDTGFDSQTSVTGRLAPSPTGAQHLGNARTYLFAWLAARKQNGRLVLRIEDIDSPRVKPGARQQSIDDLAWLGLDWDEGPDIGGPHGPYVQTERNEGYQQTIERLVQAGLAYPCTCSRKDIAEAASAPHVSHEGPVYPGTCTSWQAGDPLPETAAYCWRFRATTKVRTFVDLVCGEQSMSVAAVLGDFPLTRKNGPAAYQLAVVCDDLSMGVNQVVRGDDLIASTFRQLELIEALGGTPPQYAHVPLVCGPDGRRLAKRHGDTRIAFFREAGVPAERVIGWAAWSAGLIDRWEEVAAKDLLAEFSFARLRREPATVDAEVEERLESP